LTEVDELEAIYYQLANLYLDLVEVFLNDY